MTVFVFVVMSNDYPDSVWKNEKEADDFCKKKNAENEERLKMGFPSIYWRSYGFEVK